MYRSTSAPGPLLGQGLAGRSKQTSGAVQWQPSGVRARDWPPPSSNPAGGQRSVHVQKQALHLGFGGTLSRAGEELSGMPKSTSAEGRSVSTPSNPCLAAVSPELWAHHSKHNIVRDLYAGYATDPLSHIFRGAPAGSPSSRSDESPRQGHQSFFESYVMRQAEIERLLELSASRKPAGQPTKSGLNMLDAYRERQSIDGIGDIADVDAGPPPPAVESFLPLTQDDPSSSFQIAARTRSTVLEGDILSCAAYNGGARFVPPDGMTWRFSVRPLDPPETHPIFVGVIPAGAELTEVAFFDRKDGVFLRVGGPPQRPPAEGGDAQAEEQATSREPVQASARLDIDFDPDFYVFGERRAAPLPPPRQTPALRGWPALAVHFFQVYPREQIVTPKVQCKGCGELLATRNDFAEHCFDDVGDHPEDFGFDQYRHVEVVQEGDEIVLQNNNTAHVRFQVESKNGPGQQASVAEPDALPDGLPRLPRQVPGGPEPGTAAARRGAKRNPDGPWQPCVLLCTPGTRVQLQWLPAGPPPHIPAEPIIRPAAREPDGVKKT